MTLTTEETYDTYNKCHWYVELKSGKTVVQNDKGYPDWLKLKEYIKESKDKIVSLKVRYWDHIEDPLPRNAKGYFFSNKSVCIDGGPTIGFLLIGYVENNVIKIKNFSVPELIESVDMYEEREDLNSEAIIFNE